MSLQPVPAVQAVRLSGYLLRAPVAASVALEPGRHHAAGDTIQLQLDLSAELAPILFATTGNIMYLGLQWLSGHWTIAVPVSVTYTAGTAAPLGLTLTPALSLLQPGAANLTGDAGTAYELDALLEMTLLADWRLIDVHFPAMFY